MAKKYKITKGNSLVAKGIILNEGERIPKGLLDEDNTKKLLAAKKIEEDNSKEDAEDEAKKKAEDEAKKKAEDEAKKNEGNK